MHPQSSHPRSSRVKCIFPRNELYVSRPRHFSQLVLFLLGFPGGSEVKNPPAIGDMGSIPVSGKSPGEGNDNPLQYSCLENPMDRGSWQATVHGVARVRHNLVMKPPSLSLCQIPRLGNLLWVLELNSVRISLVKLFCSLWVICLVALWWG